MVASGQTTYRSVANANLVQVELEQGILLDYDNRSLTVANQRPSWFQHLIQTEQALAAPLMTSIGSTTATVTVNIQVHTPHTATRDLLTSWL